MLEANPLNSFHLYLATSVTTEIVSEFLHLTILGVRSALATPLLDASLLLSQRRLSNNVYSHSTARTEYPFDRELKQVYRSCKMIKCQAFKCIALKVELFFENNCSKCAVQAFVVPAIFSFLAHSFLDSLQCIPS